MNKDVGGASFIREAAGAGKDDDQFAGSAYIYRKVTTRAKEKGLSEQRQDLLASGGPSFPAERVLREEVPGPTASASDRAKLTESLTRDFLAAKRDALREQTP